MDYDSFPYNKLTRYFLESRGVDENTEYEIFTMKARDLLCPRRIDLMAKWLYIDAKNSGKGIEECLEVYKAHLRAWSKGTFTECGSPEKNSFDKYLKTFNEINNSIRERGFDETISIIPIGRHCEILDGSHRVSCAAYYDQFIKVIKFPGLSVCYDAQYFSNLGLENRYIERMVKKYMELKENTFVLYACNCTRDACKLFKEYIQAINYLEVVFYKEIEECIVIVFEMIEKDGMRRLKKMMDDLQNRDRMNYIFLDIDRRAYE